MRRLALVVFALAVLSAAVAAAAQPAVRLPRVGVLLAGAPASPFVDAFGQALRELGYTDGRNLAIEYRAAEGELARFPDLAAELVRLGVDVIVAGGTQATVAAKRATTTIPIVMVAAGDPVASGFVSSLARPGGNITGTTNVSPDLAGKQLEVLEEVVPKVARVAVLRNPANPVHDPIFRQLEAAAQATGVRLQPVEARAAKDFDQALSVAAKNRAGALLVLGDPTFFALRSRLVKRIAEARLPASFHQREFVDAGGLIAYGPNFVDLYRRAAAYVDRILKGARPADLPVEQPTKFELVVNLKTAKALGLTVPASVLARADDLIQ